VLLCSQGFANVANLLACTELLLALTIVALEFVHIVSKVIGIFTVDGTSTLLA
jgi:hypothetical protein